MVTRLLLALGVASVALMVAVPTARADSVDQRFIAALKEKGIADQSSASHAIEAAHFVCVRLDNGEAVSDVMQDVLMSSNLPVFHSGYFVGESIYAYCPRHTDEIPTK